MRKLGEKNGGRLIDKTHFVVAGGQVKSMLSWLGYMKHGEPQERVLRLKMPQPNLKPDFEQHARSFVDGIVDDVLRPPVAASESPTMANQRRASCRALQQARVSAGAQAATAARTVGKNRSRPIASTTPGFSRRSLTGAFMRATHSPTSSFFSSLTS